MQFDDMGFEVLKVQMIRQDSYIKRILVITASKKGYQNIKK